MKKPVALGLVVGLFLLGGLVGGLTTHLIYAKKAPPPPEPTLLRPPPFLRHLERRLDLTAEQHREIEAILSDSHERLETIRRRTAPEMRAVYGESVERISAVLTPEQRATFREMHRRRHERWDRFLDGPGRRGHRRHPPHRRPDRSRRPAEGPPEAPLEPPPVAP